MHTVYDYSGGQTTDDSLAPRIILLVFVTKIKEIDAKMEPGF